MELICPFKILEGSLGISEPSCLIDVKVKLIGSDSDLFEVLHFQLWDDLCCPGRSSTLNILVLRLVACKGSSSLKGIADLSSIPICVARGGGLVVLQGEGEDLLFIHVQRLIFPPLPFQQALHIHLPDTLRLLQAKGRVVKTNVNAGLESFIKGANAVSSEEEYACVVFEHPQEDRDKAVTLDIRLCALRQKNIGFIQEQHAVPPLRQMKLFSQLPFNIACSKT